MATPTPLTGSGRHHIYAAQVDPSLSTKNLAQIEIGKEFMVEHGYIQRDFDVHAWAAPEFPGEGSR